MGKHELSTNHQTTSPLMIGKTTHCAGCLHNPLFPCSRLPLYHKTIHIAVSNQTNECSSYFSSSLRSSTASDKSLQGGPALSIIVYPWPRLPENYRCFTLKEYLEWSDERLRNFLFFFISSFTSGQSRGLRKLSRLMNAERNLHHKKQQNMTSQEHFWVLLKLYVTPSNDFWTLSTKIMQSVRNHPIHTTIPVAKHAATPPWQSLQMSQQMSPHHKVRHLPLWVVPWVEGKITRSSEVVVCQRLLQCWEGLRNKKKKSNTRWTCMYCFMFEWVDESRVLHTAECSQAPTNIVTSLIPRLFSLSEHKMWSGNETIVQTDVFTTEASH